MDWIVEKTEDTALIHALTQAAFAEYGREPGTSTALKESQDAIAEQLAKGMKALVLYSPHPLPLLPTSPHASEPLGEKGNASSPHPSPKKARGTSDVGRGAGGEGREGEPIACVRYQIEGEALYFHRLSVHPDWRRQGLAKKLVGHLEALARAQGCTRLTCSVRLAKADNVALYTGLGFQLVGERSVCRDGTPIPTGDFEKPLPRLTLAEAMERYLELPRLAHRDVETLWHSDWYDGPQDGMLRFLGNLYWYDMTEEAQNDTDWYRYMVLVVLSDEEIAYERYWHEQFEERVLGRPREIRQSFYAEYKPKSYLDHPVIAWFDIFEKVGEEK